MITKIRAAKIVMASGCDRIIANGEDPDILYNLLDSESFGTRFYTKG